MRWSAGPVLSGPVYYRWLIPNNNLQFFEAWRAAAIAPGRTTGPPGVAISRQASAVPYFVKLVDVRPLQQIRQRIEAAVTDDRHDIERCTGIR